MKAKIKIGFRYDLEYIDDFTETEAKIVRKMEQSRETDALFDDRFAHDIKRELDNLFMDGESKVTDLNKTVEWLE